MLFEISYMSAGLLMAGSLIAGLFCCLEIRPILARRRAEMERLALKGGTKNLRFWFEPTWRAL